MHRLLLCSIFLLSACDIQPVAVGVWDMETEIIGADIEHGATLNSVWTIGEQRTLTIVGTTTVAVDELELAGSRISWSGPAAIIELPDATSDRVNFNGTVDGNRMFGTIYTRAGNFGVDGTRR